MEELMNIDKEEIEVTEPAEAVETAEEVTEPAEAIEAEEVTEPAETIEAAEEATEPAETIEAEEATEPTEAGEAEVEEKAPFSWPLFWDKVTTGLLILLMASPVLILLYIFLSFINR